MHKDAPIARIIGENRSFQEAYWTAQRVCWVGMGGIIIAALVGLFGASGPLSRQMVAAPGLQLDYPRTMRWTAQDELRFRAKASGDGWIRIQLPADFDDRFEVEAIQPMPEATLAGPAGPLFLFRAAGEGSANIVLRIRARSPLGVYRAPIGGHGAAALPVSILLLP